MTRKIFGIAAAATIAIAALASTTSAAPLSPLGGTGQQFRAAGDLLVEVGSRKRHAVRHFRHHLRDHRHGHRGHDYHFGYFPGHCWRTHKVVIDHVVFWKKVWVCG